VKAAAENQTAKRSVSDSQVVEPSPLRIVFAPNDFDSNTGRAGVPFGSAGCRNIRGPGWRTSALEPARS
jgi:hypothetical protein